MAFRKEKYTISMKYQKPDRILTSSHSDKFLILYRQVTIQYMCVALATLSSHGKFILNYMGIKVMCGVTFLFPIFLGLLRISLQKRKCPTNENRDVG